MNLTKFISRIPTKIAFAIVKRAMQKDKALAETWRAMIRSVVIPAMNTRTTGDVTAQRLMKRLFEVDLPTAMPMTPPPVYVVGRLGPDRNPFKKPKL